MPKRALPARLATLDKKKRRKKTKEEIAEKLAKAEQRRKVSQLFDAHSCYNLGYRSKNAHLLKAVFMIWSQEFVCC